MPTSFIQDYYPEKQANCFGCGVNNPLGHHLQSYWDGEKALCRFTPGPEQTAFPGAVYGGLIASLIDCHSAACATAAAYQAEGREPGSTPVITMVTGELKVSYKAPTPMGAELVLAARALEIHPRKVLVLCELGPEGKVTAVGNSIFVRADWQKLGAMAQSSV